MVVIRAPNELLTRDTQFAAVPDIGWPDCFNSGLLVLNPNMADYYALHALAERGISFDGADQGLLNMHFRGWDRLSFVYNCTPSGNYQYEPAYRHFASSIAVVHFIGRDKPWTLGRENRFNTGVYGELLGMWWAEYDKHYRPKVCRRGEREEAVTDVSRKSPGTTVGIMGPRRKSRTMSAVKNLYMLRTGRVKDRAMVPSSNPRLLIRDRFLSLHRSRSLKLDRTSPPRWNCPSRIRIHLPGKAISTRHPRPNKDVSQLLMWTGSLHGKPVF